jgi:hypothetical protein
MPPEDAAATRRDLRELDARIEDRFARMEERLQESMRDIQTELLKALLFYQEQIQARASALETRQAALEARASLVESRLAEIEKRLLLNPPPEA